MAAYVEGWYAFKSSKHLDAVWDLMNFHLAPKNYASFINTTGAAYVEPAAEKYIDKTITSNPSPALRQARSSHASSSRATWARSRPPTAAKLWEEFLAA